LPTVKITHGDFRLSVKSPVIATSLRRRGRTIGAVDVLQGQRRRNVEGHGRGAGADTAAARNGLTVYLVADG
jgi:hypothetical protein